LRASAASLEAANLEIVESDAMRFLARPGERFDVVFVDPPYAENLVPVVFERLAPHLAPGARVYAESAEPLDLPAGWRAVKEDRAGAVRFALYEHTP
jgi:16S rRNA (guanine966-N2)-methyltransferase